MRRGQGFAVSSEDNTNLVACLRQASGTEVLRTYSKLDFQEIMIMVLGNKQICNTKQYKWINPDCVLWLYPVFINSRKIVGVEGSTQQICQNFQFF